MLHPMSMRTALIAAVLLFAPRFVQANVELTIKTDFTSVPVKGAEKVSGDKSPTTQTVHLTLGTRWIEWSGSSGRGVYDFNKHLVISVDPNAKRLDEESLYAALSGRAAELQNRMMLGSALQAGKVADNPMAPTIAEHELSLRRDAHRPSGIEQKIGDGEQRYLWQTKELFAYSKQLVPIPAAARDLYIRYVRYVVGGHPEILDDLQKLDGIPKWLRFSDPATGNVVRLEVIASKQTPDAPYVLPSLKKADMKNPAAAAAAAVVAASTPETRAAAAARILSSANEAADKGKHLEAMLGYIEIQLMLGGEMPLDFRKHANAVVQDPNVKALIGTFGAQNEMMAKGAINTLLRLAPLAGDKAYVTGVFRANMERGLGHVETATNLFVAALTRNPFLTGVWKDLGDSLDTGYDASDTWRCYETARIIAPGHGMLADIAHREEALASEHPEYF